MRSSAEGESAGCAVSTGCNRATYESEAFKTFIGVDLLEPFSKGSSEVWISLKARQSCEYAPNGVKRLQAIYLPVYGT